MIAAIAPLIPFASDERAVTRFIVRVISAVVWLPPTPLVHPFAFSWAYNTFTHETLERARSLRCLGRCSNTAITPTT
jgi:hypothetical protein